MTPIISVFNNCLKPLSCYLYYIVAYPEKPCKHFVRGEKYLINIYIRTVNKDISERFGDNKAMEEGEMHISTVDKAILSRFTEKC